MPISSFALRTALYARLDAQITASVYSFVPQNAAFPYVRIGDVTAVTDDTFTTQMQRYDVTIHTFDKAVASTQAIETLMASVYSALHNYALTVTGYSTVVLRQERLNIFQQGEPNDRYWHGVQSFTCLLEAA